MGDATQTKPSRRPLEMRIEEITVVKGRGTLLTGPVLHGTVATGDAVEIAGGTGPKSTGTVVTAVTISGKLVERGRGGETVGLLVRAFDPRSVGRGDVVRGS